MAWSGPAGRWWTIAALLFCCGCSSGVLSPPEVTVQRVWIESMPNDGRAIACELSVRNRNYAAVNLGGGQYRLTLDGEPVGSAADHIALHIPARSSVEQTIYLYTNNRLTASRLNQIAQYQRLVRYELESTYYPGGISAPAPLSTESYGSAVIDGLQSRQAIAGVKGGPCQQAYSLDGRRTMFSTTAIGSYCEFE